jgi:isoleucyl-tRNA synthetase
LGQKFGKSVQPVAARIKEFTSQEVNQLERQGTMMLSANGVEYSIAREDVEVLHEDIEGWMVETDGTLTVALDTGLDEELLSEGLAREFVNRIQNMRKESGLEVTDRIKIYCKSQERLTKALGLLSEYVMQETLAIDISADAPPGMALVEVDINGEKASIGIEKSIDS